MYGKTTKKTKPKPATKPTANRSGMMAALSGGNGKKGGYAG
jgi:hypothetical protein|tara:strand:- start:1618 stop:1740 length:123 start_codon:yes stop_codon:yes gene_type:complete